MPDEELWKLAPPVHEETTITTDEETPSVKSATDPCPENLSSQMIIKCCRSRPVEELSDAAESVPTSLPNL